MNIAKRDGERGHPCLVSLCKMKFCEINPLVVTVAIGDVYSALTQLINDSLNPNFCNVANKNFQLTLSNAFTVSSDEGVRFLVV